MMMVCFFNQLAFSFERTKRVSFKKSTLEATQGIEINGLSELFIVSHVSRRILQPTFPFKNS